MDVHMWLAFVVAASVLLVLPGPTVLLVVGCALGGGARTARATVPGVVLGDGLALTLSLVGLGAVLAASALLFTVLKLAGAAYLVYLGIRMWRSPAAAPHVPDAGLTGGAAGADRTLFLRAFFVTATNPKSIAFFVAFVPQFLDHARPLGPQMFALGLTFTTLAAINTTAWALLAGRARDALRRPSWIRALQRTGGALLVAAGVATASLRRAV
ncbi:MAG: LysE family translocator [Desulfovibrionaceae bacterium]